MGHKKRNPASRSPKPSSPAATPPEFDPSPPPSAPHTDESSISAIKLDCEKALTAFRRGNHNKSLRLIKEAAQRHETSPLVHRCQATIFVKVAGIIDDHTAKNRHLRLAIDSARRACSLSPDSVEFAHFYANLLYEAAQEGREYEEVVGECERALAIEKPVDPARESFQEEQKIATAEGRIGSVHAELRSLIQKANIASISTWMKNFGGSGEEKFRLIPIRRPVEDPMEMSFVQARRPNEIKKATKTPEERRKEIEVRVAAARLLQQRAETETTAQGESKVLVEISSNGGGGGGKSTERRRHGSYHRRNVSNSERRDQVRSYWNSMSNERKSGFGRVSVSDMKAHFGSCKDVLGYEVLCEGLAYGELKRTWKFCMCCQCGESFVDGKSHVKHVIEDHMGDPMPKLEKAFPPSVDSEWAEMIASCAWQALDITESTAMLLPLLKFADADEGVKDDEGEKDIEGDKDDEGEKDDEVKAEEEESKDCLTDSYCTEDAWGPFSEKQNLVDCCNGDSLEGKEIDKYVKIDCMECNEGQDVKVYTMPNSWPLSADNECSKILEKIGSILQLLIRHKCLSVSLLQKVIEFTMEELRRLAPDSPILSCGIDQTPLCMCFLGTGQVRKILKFLQEVSNACGVGRYPEKIGPDDTSTPHQLLDSQDQLVLNEDVSFLLLDESLLPNDGVGVEVVGPTTGVGIRNCTTSTSDSLLSWIFAGPSTGEQLALWSRTREERKEQTMELLQLLEKEFVHLQTMCERKFEHVGYAESLQGMEELCIEERNKREHVMDFTCSSYEAVLRNCREEIIAGDKDAINKYELDAINVVLKEAESIKATQYGFEDNYASVTSHLCDIESGEEDWKAKDYINQEDTCIEIAIQRQREQLSVEQLSKIDARIMRSVSSVQQLEHKLESLSALDYSSILLPLVKSFLRAQLEDLAEKDATEKSDAAREAFLAELALDSKKNVGGGSDHSKQTNDKLKDKKKNRGFRKGKDTKISSLSNLVDNGEPAFSNGAASDGECVDSEMAVSDSDDDLKKMEEFKRKIELEAEERKLEETLEYQRRIENEAKQKHLAEQQRGFPHLGEVVEANNGYPKNFFSTERNPADGAATLLNSQRDQPSKFSQGLTNGKIPHDDACPFEQEMGRKGKRRGSAKLREARNQAVPSGKENAKIDVWADKHDDPPGVWDGGSKPLGLLQAEDDDEERFQADLEKALRQSLDTFQTHRKVPVAVNLRALPKISEDVDHICPLAEVLEENGSALDVYGTGLQNRVGEYNCFLNVIIQSLWHIQEFREKLLSRPRTEHAHVGDPCVVCALYDILSALSKASMDGKRDVSPTSLRIALSNLYPESNFFQEGQMNDASEVLAVIFECLHQSVTSASVASDNESVESNCLGSWDCFDPACIVHSLFGMNIYERMNCYTCGLESRHLKYTSFFHNVNACSLRTMKAMCPVSPLDEILNLVEMNHQLACDPEVGGCGKLNHIHHILSKASHVFTTAIGWQNTSEDVVDIAATLSALTTEIDISGLYRGVDPKNMRRLVSVVCYYGQHYHCFAYSQDSEQWIMYDDKTVKVIGTWEDVIAKCEKGHLQPQLLFFEAV